MNTSRAGRATAVALVAATLSASPAAGMYCSTEVENAQERVRQEHVSGMTDLASQNFSARPGTFGDMACLEGLMQGQMDLLFRPPDLQSLLQQVVSFACDALEDAVGDALGGVGDLSDFGSLTGGGLKLPVGAGGGGGGTANRFGTMFGGN